MRASRRRTAWVAWSLAATMVACAGAPPPPLPLSGTFVIGPALNPDRDGQPSPVFVRVYQLKAREGFMAASFHELERDDEKILGADVLHREILEFCPSEPAGEVAQPQKPECRTDSSTLTMSLQPGARYLAAFAEFYDVRDPKGNWRAVVELPAVQDPVFGGPRIANFNISLTRTTLSLAFE